MQGEELLRLLQGDAPGRRHVDINNWGGRDWEMKESDYVKLLMDLEGIVIKVLTLS